MLEAAGILVAILLGLFGTAFSIFQFLWNKNEKERDRIELEREKAEMAREKEREKAERERERKTNMLELERRDRIEFLRDVIFNDKIVMASREKAYEEYIQMKANGFVIDYWSRAKGVNQPLKDQ